MGFVRSMALAGIVALGLAGPGLAQSTEPKASAGDPRMRSVIFNPNQVVALRGHLGYQMMIEFDPNERIESVSIGDSVSWQVTPNRRATMLFVKPVERNAATNMTVVTSLRRYAFELTAREAKSANDPNIIFGIRFLYPDGAGQVMEISPQGGEAAAFAKVENLNFGYNATGDRRLHPDRVFDDGRTTFFEFREGVEPPAIFLVDAAGKEELVNSQTRGPYIAVDAVGDRFALRLGKSRAQVRREGGAKGKTAATEDRPKSYFGRER